MVPIGLTGIAMLFFLSQGLRDSMTDKALRWYGEASLGIFVLSPFFQGLGREIVSRVLHTNNPFPYLLFTTFWATTIPAVFGIHAVAFT